MKIARLMIFLLVLGFAGGGCSKDEGPKIPGAVNLTYPGDNTLCVTGTPVGATSSEVVFRWEATAHAATYQLSVYRDGGSLVEQLATSGTSAPVVLARGVAFTWRVIARNAQGDVGPASLTWQFYNAGASESYAPFPARLELPASGSTVASDGNGEVLLRWSGADPDNDLQEFEVYVGLQPNALTRQTTQPANSNTYRVSVNAGTVVYWEILSRDSLGNTSRSGVGSFRVL
ncbi:hypothetical protein OZ410_02575 [Robiginitalea sp. M366]|uniref:hypothetical protein n=1 Tax=Robiginitalea aestuariiviva TaxID=3036903 RepID=UPI00240D7337|nr:hypothetical protein [Robiginitalea aestuariiviva]MDG1571183.1 hypothetical protein [Robiginitalea aestuariiviva]